MEMFPSMPSIVPAGIAGVAKVDHFDVSKEASQFTAFRPGGYVPPGSYARLYVAGQLMMSDTRFEHTTNYDFVRAATGRVLVAGLGLGMVLHPVAAKSAVTSIVVLEKYADVVALVGPTVPAKVSVVCADVFEHSFPKGERFDVIYFDIWPNLCTDNLGEMTRLHRRYRKHLAPGGWMGSWCRELLRSRRRQEKRSGW